MELNGVEKPAVPGVGTRLDRATWLGLAACAVLFLILRCRWIGHLLVWDEAMALCTSRAFSAGGDDPFAAWFWRHPPLHTLLLLVLQPLQAGFAERAEILSIGIGLVNQTLVFFLNRRVFGTTVGLWSALLMALLPGVAFFDVWIKQDTLVMTFGLLALLALCSEHAAACGICLGLALLTKGTAAFYCLAVFILCMAGARDRSQRKRHLKNLGWIVGVSALTCGWWYVGVVPRVRVPGGADTFQFALNARTLWQSEWYFYFAQLPTLLGWLGVALAGTGAVLAARSWRRPSAEASERSRAWIAWPLCLLAPSLLLLSIVPNKVPWVIIALAPAWATLGALAVNGACSLGLKLSSAKANWLRPALAGAAALVLAVVMTFTATGDYESMLRRVASSQWRGAANSKEAASVLNQNVHDGDRILVTSFHYWQGLPPGLPDPIFTYYLTKKPSVLLRSHRRSFDDVVADIRAYQLDWALLSPEPGDAAALFGGFEQQLGLSPQKTTGAWLYRTAGVPPRAKLDDTASVGR